MTKPLRHFWGSAWPVRFGIGIVSLLMLTGCSAGQCDPAQTTFFDGIGCAVGGGWRERQDILSNAQQASQNQSANAGRQALYAQDQERQSEAALADARARVYAQDHDLATMRRRLDQLRSQYNSDARVEQASAALADAERLRRGATESPAALTARADALARARNILHALTGA